MITVLSLTRGFRANKKTSANWSICVEGLNKILKKIIPSAQSLVNVKMAQQSYLKSFINY